jgi:putative heme-binding domain-containing protein
VKALLAALLTLPLCLRAAEALPVNLPDGLTAEIAAAPPLVQHPIMAALGGPGQLFVGDAAGLNLNKAELEKQLPNRVLLLTDTNADGVYDKVSVFADKMTFPQGGVWLDGSLYVAGSFDFTGNAADVHGPFLHPNGRLYWCHGRKGHDVKQRDGTPVHAGLASGIWSCRPDGSDIRWHSLGCGDNPVEIDFTPEGEILGTQNIFYTNPRGDTIVHWLRGGVYPREDMLKAIAGLPRTLDAMPVVHNFGHSGVSGVAFYRSGALNPEWRGHLFVAHFNTQRITRMEMEPSGASYKVAEREFFKLRNSDAHLTDVLEDRDGTMLIVDTGGWFRIGCPSSLMAKPDVAGAIYRVKTKGAPAKVERWGAATDSVWAAARAGDSKTLTDLLQNTDTSIAHAAANALAGLAKAGTAPALTRALRNPDPGVELAAARALGELKWSEPTTISALLQALETTVPPELEHQLMWALIQANQPELVRAALARKANPWLQMHALMILDQLPGSTLAQDEVVPRLSDQNAPLAEKAADLVARRPEWLPALAELFQRLQKESRLTADLLPRFERALKPNLDTPAAREILTSLLQSADLANERSGWRLLATAALAKPEELWSAALQQHLARATPNDVPLVLDALAKNGGPAADASLRAFASDAARPQPLRIKALGAAIKPGAALAPESFELLAKALVESPAASARLESARILAKAKIAPAQFPKLAAAFGSLGPLEMRELVKLVRQAKSSDEARLLAAALRDAPALGALQESEVRTAFQSFPPEVFEVVAPALRALAVEDEARRRKLETLPALVLKNGRAAEGRQVFESGKGACIGCHRIGELGNLVGPNLSGIGQIRTERDLLESILFPSATLARDYEAHSFDLAGGETIIGVIRGNTGPTLTIADATGQERTLAREQIVGMQTLPTSLMPTGLDRVLTEQELLDLVAFLRSRREAPAPSAPSGH